MASHPRSRARTRSRVYVGTSGWAYRHWRRNVYPTGLRQRDELAWLASRVTSIELNAPFYSLQRTESYRKWHDAVPDDFLFAVKGSRFITHTKQLRNVESPLANFFASGVLALQQKLGPFVWQLPARMTFDAARFEQFLALLPRNTDEAASLARQHDDRVEEPDAVTLTTGITRPLRHALEPRSVTFVTPDCISLLRQYDVALVIADSGRWPRFEEITASFVYARLHGAPQTYASRYPEEALRTWAARFRQWKRGHQPPDAQRVTALALPGRRARDVYVYFDNDARAHAPRDAMALIALMDPHASHLS